MRGARCLACGHTVAFRRLRCPRCHGEVREAVFGPQGTVWSSTVVRVPVPDRTPPYGLAYVDLDDGPRVLAHVAADGQAVVPAPIGSTVRLVPATHDGDLQVEVVA